jgi:4-hydroxy-tetrahydrodipicolinate reductase
MAVTRILVAGAAGRMGRALIREALSTPGVALAGGFERPGHADIGADLGPLAGLDAMGLFVETAPTVTLLHADALIDFTTPDATLANAAAAADAGAPIIIGTTGFAPGQEAALDAIARRIAVVKSGNMSLGVNLLSALVREAAARLGPDYDIEIVEAHHRAKADAPSGTALMLARAAALGRGADFNASRAPIDRAGVRAPGAIGFAVVRGGGVVGDHDVLFAGAQETIRLSHRAIDRGLFAKGAIAAARWARGKPPGLYSMTDVLGFPSQG